MIGNIVSVDGVPQRIRSITRRKIGYCQLTNPNQSYAKLHEVKPIPITVDFLQKNGFELDEEFMRRVNIPHYIVRMGTYSIRIGFFHGFTCIDVVDKNNMLLALEKGRYVHQIQNLLNLCNIQWEVKI